MDLLYHILIGAATLAASPLILLWMVLKPAFRQEIFDRINGTRSLPELRESLWIHASSVGEVRVAKILMEALKGENGKRPLALSTFTRSGYDLAKKEGLDPVFRLPPDFPFWLNPVFEKIHPSALILIEAEFWPSLLHLCRRRGVPVLLVNGRVSQKSLDRYANIKPFFRWMTKWIYKFSMRSQSDADRLIQLGVPGEKILVTGNMKFDFHENLNSPDMKSRDEEKAPRLVFGSTRPGDEGPIMDAILRLRSEFPLLHCVIAPRHLERCREVEDLIREYKVEFIRHSQLGENDGKDGGLILLDQMGELNHYYSLGTVAFVGGSFNPRFGGQNILEPAMYRLPVIFGKYMNNFAEEARLLTQSGGGIQISTPEELYPTLHRLLTHPEERRQKGNFAAETVRNHQGAVFRNIDIIKKMETAGRSSAEVE